MFQLFAMFVLLLIGATKIAADCCHPVLGMCNDDTPGTPYCGVGRCDSFGCKCDGECRTGKE